MSNKLMGHCCFRSRGRSPCRSVIESATAAVMLGLVLAVAGCGTTPPDSVQPDADHGFAALTVPAATSAFTTVSIFRTTEARNSNVVLLDGDETHLFVSNQGSASITVVAVDSNGLLALHGIYPTIEAPVGMALDPTGQRLYVAGYGGIAVHSISSDGTLTSIEPWSLDAPLPPIGYSNSLAYVARPDGDVLYVNENRDPNSVAVYGVQPDGTLIARGSFATGGWAAGSVAAAQRIVVAGNRLFATNANSIAVFDIEFGGRLDHVAGSPFALPDGITSSGGIAVTPDVTALYAGTVQTRILRYTVSTEGSLSLDGLQPCSGVTEYGNNGLTVEPTGRYLVVDTPYLGIDVFEIPTMHRIGNAAVNRGPGTMHVFNSSGTLAFAGVAGFDVAAARAWRFLPAPEVPELTCVGRFDAPATMSADPGTCLATIDNTSMKAGGCTPTSGGLASCTFDGAPYQFLRVGDERWVEVVGTAETGNLTSCTSFVRVADREGPAISAPAATPWVLWPPDGRMVDVIIHYTATDNCDWTPTCHLEVSANESDAAAWEVVDPHHVRLRAARAGAGSSRVYTIGVACMDAVGNGSRREVAVAVPHDARS